VIFSLHFQYEYGRVTLIIPQAYPNDAGSYVLSAKNLAGEAYTSCNVIVKGRLPNETFHLAKKKSGENMKKLRNDFIGRTFNCRRRRLFDTT